MLLIPDELRKTRLISDKYLAQQKKLHENPDYGTASVVYAPIVARVMNQYGIEQLLDYGAGKGRLGQTLIGQKLVDHRFILQQYEPTNPEWSDLPEPMEMVACIDVLEHIEPELLDNVLDDLKRCAMSVGVFSVATEPAKKVLDDGRNAHLIVKPAAWWLPQIMERWDMHVFQKTPDGFFVVVMAKEVQ